MKRKILQVISSTEFGGGTKHVQEVYRHCHTDVDFYLAAPTNILALNEEKFIKIEKSRVNLVDIFRLALFIRKSNLTMLHAHGRGAALICRILKVVMWNINIVYTLHGVHVSFKRNYLKLLYLFYEQFWAKLDLARIFVSESERDSYENFWSPSRKHFVVYNSIDDDTYINKNFLKYDVGVLTRLHPQKNLKEFLNIAKCCPSVNFVIAGDGPELGELKNHAVVRDINNVKFMGFTDDQETFFNSIRLYLSTSNWEGLPYSVLESISYNVPVILKDVVGHRDFVVEQKGASLYRDPTHASQLIKNLLSDHFFYNQKVQELELLKEKFSREQFKERLSSIYFKTIR